MNLNFNKSNSSPAMLLWVTMCVLCLSLVILFPYNISGQIHSENKNQNTSLTGNAIKKGFNLTNIKQISRVTGTSLPGESLPSPNRTAEQFDVAGTDLGIMWALDKSRVGLFFGDTNGAGFVAGKKGGGNGGNWRSNVVAFTSDLNLEDGLTIDFMALDSSGKAAEICAGAKNNPGKYNTSIPTSAIRVNGVDYVHYMNIYEWAGGNGRWLTNFSSIYTSSDDAKTWQRKVQVSFQPDSKFSQIAYAAQGAFVYMVGTLAGRGSPAYLARIHKKDMLHMERYEYWNGITKTWVKNNEAAATPIIEGPVGEASLIYHEKYKRWIIAYSYDSAYERHPDKKYHAIVYRDAEALNGTWSELKILTTASEYPGLYSPYFHPLKNKEDKLYFTMSLWQPYNVFLMSADIKIN